MKGFFSIKESCENTTIIERSKFICNMCSIESETDAKNFIETIRKKHPFATHNCYSYIADEKGLIQKFSDDGEPQGTAGQPMLEVLKAKKLYKTIAVVTRYFGGIKLGAGGLVRAYSNAVGECISNAKILNFVHSSFYSMRLTYEEYPKVLSFLKTRASQCLLEITQTEFLDNVTLNFVVENEICEEFIKKFFDSFCGQIKIKFVKNDFYPYNNQANC